MPFFTITTFSFTDSSSVRNPLTLSGFQFLSLVPVYTYLIRSIAKQILLTNMAPPITSNASQTITTIIFGIVATLISIVTIWQGCRKWRILHQQRDLPADESGLESQIELASIPPSIPPASPPSAPPSVPSIFELPAGASTLATPTLAAAASDFDPPVERAVAARAAASSTAPATPVMSPT